MPIRFPVLPARNVNPIILAVGGLEDELVEIGVMLQPVEPLAGSLKVGMTLVVVPGCIAGEWQTDVGSFTQGVLGGIGSTNLHIKLVATVAGADDNGATNETTERFKHLLVELLQRGDVL